VPDPFKFVTVIILLINYIQINLKWQNRFTFNSAEWTWQRILTLHSKRQISLVRNQSFRLKRWQIYRSRTWFRVSL